MHFVGREKEECTLWGSFIEEGRVRCMGNLYRRRRSGLHGKALKKKEGWGSWESFKEEGRVHFVRMIL